jgi:hypothetical protein
MSSHQALFLSWVLEASAGCDRPAEARSSDGFEQRTGRKRGHGGHGHERDADKHTLH